MTLEKEALLSTLNHNLALVTLIGFIGVVLFGVTFFLIRAGVTKKGEQYFKMIAGHAFPLGFLIVLFAVVTSLVYSDYLGVLPCGLCWFQRVFIYSQLFIIGHAWWKGDTKVWGYSAVLSAFGLIVALYHQYLQLGYSEFIPCPAIASTVDCAKPTFIEYGFVTFPLMSIVLFGFLLILAHVVKFYKK
jgi:disulfide bond formation protein DsbB